MLDRGHADAGADTDADADADGEWLLKKRDKEMAVEMETQERDDNDDNDDSDVGVVRVVLCTSAACWSMLIGWCVSLTISNTSP